ncbi:hypothetical protein [Yersinia ruckeri]|uniref:hypothetical protein n=1 Tax=Yersinia ruckeri TaxID=29486 RepID=UPI002238223C|nr:hypothetical protein [Yersinia ruckeri]MCW6598808.1 hypothetical protein [Yersinia ruckeri]
MPVRLRPRYFGELTREEAIERIDPLGCILNGAYPIGAYFVDPNSVANEPPSSKVTYLNPPVGEMLGWIEKETSKLTIGMLVHKDGHTYLEDHNDKWINNFTNQKIWIRFNNPALLRGYKEEDQLTVDGKFSSNVVLTSKHPPQLKREVLWIDIEGDFHLGKRINDEEMEITTYGGQEDLIKSLNNFPYWVDMPMTYIAHRLNLGDEPLDEGE